MRCLLCFSAVNGKELSSCLSEIFPFFLPTACTVKSWQLYPSVSSAARVPHTVKGKSWGQHWLLWAHPTAEQRHGRFQVIFFFLAESTDLEDAVSLYWFQQTVSDPTKQLNLNQFWKTQKYLDILWNEISVVVYCLRGHLISEFLLCFCFFL